MPDYNDKAFGLIASWVLNRDLLRFKDLEWTLLSEIYVLADYLCIQSLEEELLTTLRWKRREYGIVPVSSVPFIYN